MNSDGFVFDQEIVAQTVAARFRIAEISVPVRYFPEASSASFLQSTIYGLKILLLVARFFVHRSSIVRFKKFESLRARYTRLSGNGGREPTGGPKTPPPSTGESAHFATGGPD
jgi:hypothetical protein